MKTPIPHAYWVVPGKMLAGEYPINIEKRSSRKKMAALIDAGTDVFIDLTEEGEYGLRSYQPLIQSARHHRLSIHDASTPSSTAFTSKILNTIDESLSDGKGVYVHCFGGIGRTGLVVGCWLARHGDSGEAALDRLQELWKDNPKSKYQSSPETPSQKEYILNWKPGQ